MTTLAEYNNNPGNIRPAKGVKYEGLIGVDDKGFGIFEKPEYGQKALIDSLLGRVRCLEVELVLARDARPLQPPGDEHQRWAREVLQGLRQG